ncbi:MAG: hypothetical protein GQ570_03090 [Helicobacteraceae bacterium]|nr:hypothetical protein [Helicobacteraceae bacterium]
MTTTRERNLFYNVIRNETSLTEFFCNLMQLKPFLNMFQEVVKKKSQDFPYVAFNDFDTEINFNKIDAMIYEESKFGRGDLVVNFDNKEYIFELKIEKYTKITENQPNGYLNYLRKQDGSDVNSRLFFILPKGYRHIEEISKRWSDYTKKQILNHNIIYWEDILNEIKKLELDKLNPFINEFVKIMEYRWLYCEDINFSNFEISIIFNNTNKNEELIMSSNMNIPKIVNKLFKIVDGLYEKNVDKIDKKHDKQQADYYGYISKDSRIPKDWEVWFGVDFELWEKADCPLTIQVYSENEEEMKKINNINILTQFEYTEGAKTTYISLDKDAFQNSNSSNIIEIYNDLFDSLLNNIENTYVEW